MCSACGGGGFGYCMGPLTFAEITCYKIRKKYGEKAMRKLKFDVGWWEMKFGIA